MNNISVRESHYRRPSERFSRRCEDSFRMDRKYIAYFCDDLFFGCLVTLPEVLKLRTVRW
jgi:hypothetical protein